VPAGTASFSGEVDVDSYNRTYGMTITAHSDIAGYDYIGLYVNANGGADTATGVDSVARYWGVWAQSTVGGAGVIAMGPSGHYDFLANGAGVDYGSTSSIRWKKDVTPMSDALDRILKLRGVYFNWDAKHGGQHDLGMIAEEVGKEFPEIVVWDKDAPGYADGMDYSRLTPALVEAVKAQQNEINDLKSKYQDLEARLKALEDAVKTR
jgi:hypothetical protein